MNEDQDEYDTEEPYEEDDDDDEKDTGEGGNTFWFDIAFFRVSSHNVWNM